MWEIRLLDGFYFFQPQSVLFGLFFALLFFTVIIAFLFMRSWRQDRRLARLLGHTSNPAKTYAFIFILLLIFFGSLVGIIARPQRNIYESLEVPPRADIVFLVDVSRSMEARTLAQGETKLEIAQRLMKDIISNVPDARYLIFGYSSFAFPLSSFSNEQWYLLDVIENGLYIEVIPADTANVLYSNIWRSSFPANALAAVAVKRLNDPSYQDVKHIILFSDGSDGEYYFKEALDKLVEAELSVISVGVGSREGDRIPLLDEGGQPTGGFVILKDGTVFTSFLQEEALRELSARTGGRYFSQNNGSRLISYIRSTLPGSEFTPDIARQVEDTEDIGWIFYPTLILATTGLAWKFKKFY